MSVNTNTCSFSIEDVYYLVSLSSPGPAGCIPFSISSSDRPFNGPAVYRPITAGRYVTVTAVMKFCVTEIGRYRKYRPLQSLTAVTVCIGRLSVDGNV